MTPSQLMQALSDAGAPFEAILIAVQALETKDAEIAARDAVAAEKRAKDAARKREERELARAVQGLSTDGPETVQAAPLSRPPNEIYSNPPTHTHPDKQTPRAREGDPFPKPEFASDQLWRDLKANRKLKRLACTPTAHGQLLRDIEKYTDDDWPPGRVLEAAVARGWAAVPADPRETETRKNGQHPHPAKPTTRDIGQRVAASFARTGDRAVDLLPGPRSACGNE